MSTNVFASVAKSAVSTTDRNPWSVQVDVERESGLYRHPVTDEPISLGGAVYVAIRGKAGQTVMPNGQTFRQNVAAVLSAHGQTLRGFRRISLDDKVALHKAIAKSAKRKAR